ncbi:Protein BCCIP [Ananas comosus]|uniref:Protein BCCIP n=1 Tax=Ananas comosus TaxID=4615 RepID=A0A199VT40_ANACO|nr:Protein BCCIP [Ananas comosus]
MTQRRSPPPKRRRVSRPRPLLGFSPFARCVLLSRVASASASASKPPPRTPPSSSSSTPHRREPKEEGIGNPKPLKPTKRIESSSDDEDDEEEEEQEVRIVLCFMLETVQADFGFFDPKPGDFHGAKLLLQSYLDNEPWDLSGFVDLVLNQTTVGTVVRLDGYDDDNEGDGDNGSSGGDDDEDLYGIVTALNLKRYAEHKCIKELKKFLLGVCRDENTKKKLKLLLEEQASQVGLLVSQRFVNCPYQLVPPLYDALFDEVSWATEDEPTQELRDSFRFKSYLLISRIYERDPNKPKGKRSVNQDEPVIYIKAEDEIFHELSTWSFTFPVHAEQLVPDDLKNYRQMGLVLVVKADDVPKFRDKLKSLVAAES